MWTVHTQGRLRHTKGVYPLASRMTRYIALFAVLHILLITTECATFRRVCYYASWSRWRPGAGRFHIADVNPHLCTHIIFAFAGFDTNTATLTTPSRAQSTTYAELNGLKTKQPQLTTLLAVGGWNVGSAAFSRLARNATLREAFVSGVVTQVTQHGFDGVDVDWEYPQTTQDKHSYVVLLKDLHSAFKHSQVRSERSSRYVVTCAVPVTQFRLQYYDVPGMVGYVDFFNVMTYDYHGSWETRTGMNSPLYKRKADSLGHATFNTDWAMQYLVKLGAPKNKLNLGIATYGRSWTLNSRHENGIGAPASKAGPVQTFSQQAGILSYYEICTKLPSGKEVFDSEARVPYFVDGTFWVSYDNDRSVTEKAEYVKSNNFGGVMFWTIDFDDFNNQCGAGRYPLLCSVSSVLAAPSSTCRESAAAAASSNSKTPKSTAGAASDTADAHQPNTVIAANNTHTCIDGLHRLVTDCSGYYQCWNGVRFDPQFCPAGLLFNDQHKYCDWPRNVGCKPTTN